MGICQLAIFLSCANRRTSVLLWENSNPPPQPAWGWAPRPTHATSQAQLITVPAHQAQLITVPALAPRLLLKPWESAFFWSSSAGRTWTWSFRGHHPERTCPQMNSTRGNQSWEVERVRLRSDNMTWTPGSNHAWRIPAPAFQWVDQYVFLFVLCCVSPATVSELTHSWLAISSSFWCTSVNPWACPAGLLGSVTQFPPPIYYCFLLWWLSKQDGDGSKVWPGQLARVQQRGKEAGFWRLQLAFLHESH